MKKTLVLFFLLSPMSFAKVTFAPVRQILIRGESCEELEFHARSILDWKEAITKTPVNMPECFCSSTSCQMDVRPISPARVKELNSFEEGFERTTAHNGPNCFNSALYFSSTLTNITFTHPYEISTILASSLCKERGPSEDLQPGDLLAVRDQSDSLLEIHAGIYINDQLSFSKYGEGFLMPYSYGIDVDKSYGVRDKACRRVYGTPAPGDQCYRKPYVNYFTCQPIYSFISKVVNEPNGINESARQLYAKTSRLDSKIAGIAYKGAKIDTQNLILLLENVRVQYDQSDLLLKDAALSRSNRELVRLMRARLYSLYGQLRIIAKDRGEEELASAGLRNP